MVLRKQLFILLQVLLWIGFCLMPILFLPLRPEGGSHPAFHSPGGFIFVFVIKNIKFILLFYIHYLVLIPRYFNRERFVQYFVLLALMLAVVAAIPFITEWLESPQAELLSERPGHRHPHLGFRLDAGMHFFMTIIVTIFPFMLHSYRNWISVQKDKTEMELAFLKSQINHHFLFNSLNSIYSLSLQGNARTSPSIHSLSFILRYVLDESVKRKTALRHELEYIQHFIELQRLRLNERTQVDYRTEGDPGDMEISPMLLIPFIENCFKHGVSTVSSCTISILITMTDGELHLHTDNDLLPVKSGQRSTSGIGLTNVAKRLELDYSGRYTLDQKLEGERYITDLKINLA